MLATALSTVLSVGYAVAISLVFSAIVTLIAPRWHGALKRIVTLAWIITTVIFLVAIAASFTDLRTGGVITVVGYLVAVVAVLPLLGIGRLGEPPAPGEAREEGAPVLAPDQIARVDAVAAIVIGIAYGVVVWRLFSLFALS